MLITSITFQFLIWWHFACSCFALFHLYFRIQTVDASERSHSPVSAMEISTARASECPPGKTVVVLSNISLPHPEKGDIVNIRPSTKILNLAFENLQASVLSSFCSKQKSLKAANNKSSHKRKLIRRTVYQTFNTKLDMVKTLVYCIKWNRNLHDMLTSSVKPSKFIFSSSVQSHAIDLSSPYLNKLLGAFWDVYHLKPRGCY